MTVVVSKVAQRKNMQEKCVLCIIEDGNYTATQKLQLELIPTAETKEGTHYIQFGDK